MLKGTTSYQEFYNPSDCPARLDPTANSGLPFLLIFLFTRRTLMSFVDQPQITLTETSDYRDTYANSVQIRMSVWDFHLAFGTLQSQADNKIEVRNFQGVYLSPQQAKALTLMLQQNLANYEQAFGEIKLDPNMAKGPIH
jgi:flagellar protein FlaG